MKQYFLFLCACFLISFSFAQQSVFSKTYGWVGSDQMRAVKQTGDGGYVMVGETDEYQTGNFDLFVVKTDANGDTLWTTGIGGPNEENGMSVQVLPGNNYLVQGYTRSFGAGDYDLYAARLDGNGDTLWTRTYGDTTIDYTVSNTCTAAQTLEGGFMMAATTAPPNFGIVNIYIVKTDQFGNMIWGKKYGNNTFSRASSIIQTSDSCFVVTGFSTDNNINGEVCLMKIDSGGNVLWAKNYITATGEGMSVQQTIDGGFILFAQTSAFNPNNYFDMMAIKTDANGNVMWSKVYGNDTLVTYMNAGMQTNDGNYIMCGDSRTVSVVDFDGFLVRLDNNGDTLFTKTLSNSNQYDFFNGLDATSDGGFVATGGSDNYAVNYFDGYLVKFNQNGQSWCNEVHRPTRVSSVTLPVVPYTPPVSNLGHMSYVPSFMRHGVTHTNTICSSPASVSSIENLSAVKIYPNPFSSSAIVEINFNNNQSATEKTFTLIDAYGNAVKEISFTDSSLSIDRGDLAPGIYFYKIISGENIETGKIIIE